uniref:Uncharacterized protein n=1 Tax=Arundo donax TaxID=35708 RepID=A0A0A9S748_ARUDO
MSSRLASASYDHRRIPIRYVSDTGYGASLPYPRNIDRQFWRPCGSEKFGPARDRALVVNSYSTASSPPSMSRTGTCSSPTTDQKCYLLMCSACTAILKYYLLCASVRLKSRVENRVCLTTDI